MVILLTGCGRDVLTVTEVWKDAQSLDGKKIHMRGRAHVFTVPYEGLIGCPPGGDVVIVGKMELLDEDTPDPGYYSEEEPLPRIAIPESSLQCSGDYCMITCAPFDPGCSDDCIPTREYVFEMVGTLRVSPQQGQTILVLEDLDLGVSRRLNKDGWESIPMGMYEYGFP
jgi:hypothetical protein